jgi:hypothetical protein
MGKYFDTGWLKPITPVTNQIGTGSEDDAFADQDIVWDWLAINIPKGTHRLINASMIVQGTHGARQAEVDFQLWFAAPIDGVVPPSIGTPNSAVTGTGHRKHMIGIVDFDATHAGGDCFKFNSFYSTGTVSRSGAQTSTPGLIVTTGGDSESSGTNVGMDKIYVAGIALGALNFSTNVLTTGSVSASTSSTDITVDTVHATKVFEVGDIIQAMDLAEIGTITALSTTSITVDACAGALANNDEILTTSPVKIRLGFER